MLESFSLAFNQDQAINKASSITSDLKCNLLNTMIEADPLITEEEVACLAMGIEEAEIMVTMITETMEIMITGIFEMVITGIMEKLEIMEILKV